MFNKNIFQNGEKTIEGVMNIFNPLDSVKKDQEKVEVQSANSDRVLLNTDYNLPKIYLDNGTLMSLTENESAKKFYDQYVSDAKLIDFQARKEGTYNGVHIDFGVPFLDLINKVIQLSEMLDYKGQPIIDDNGQAINTILAYADDIRRYSDTGEISERLKENGNIIKHAIFAELKQAKTTFYYSDTVQSGGSMIMKTIDDLIAKLDPMVTIYDKGPDETAVYMENKIISAANSVYDYVKSDNVLSSNKTSRNAKERLINNPWYHDYLETISKSSPELYNILGQASEMPYITKVEEKAIRQINQNASEISKQRDILEEEYGWQYMNEIFSAPQANGSSWNDLLKLTWDLNNTALDDEIENTIGSMPKITLGYDSYLSSNFSLDPGASLKLPTPKDNATGTTADSTPKEKPEVLVGGAGMRYDPKTKTMVARNYEEDKKLPHLRGREMTKEEYQRVRDNQYAQLAR